MNRGESIAAKVGVGVVVALCAGGTMGWMRSVDGHLAAIREKAEAFAEFKGAVSKDVEHHGQTLKRHHERLTGLEAAVASVQR